MWWACTPSALQAALTDLQTILTGTERDSLRTMLPLVQGKDWLSARHELTYWWTEEDMSQLLRQLQERHPSDPHHYSAWAMGLVPKEHQGLNPAGLDVMDLIFSGVLPDSLQAWHQWQAVGMNTCNSSGTA